MYPTSISEKPPFFRFRLFKQSDMFFEQIVPDLDVGVKVLRPHVGKHLFAARAAVPHTPLRC